MKHEGGLTCVCLDAFCFAVALSYAITDITALQGGSNTFPLANIYLQATTSAGGIRNPGAAFALLFILLGCSLTCCVGLTLTVSPNIHETMANVPCSCHPTFAFSGLIDNSQVSRTYWALARDGAVPLSQLFGEVNERLSCPVWSTLFVCKPPRVSTRVPCGSQGLTQNLQVLLQRGWEPSLWAARRRSLRWRDPSSS